ncbi:MAG: carboxypeptidase-like regulatory domain-containing protein [Salinivirgaceae bacterium]|nr:carboxypeptidase-like regulatory domain-containing protein [Salinivirgaceae bacterium]
MYLKKTLFAALCGLICCANVLAQNKITISGHITDRKSAETIIGATVYDSETQRGTATNVFGFYSITLNAGKHNLTYSYVGCQPQTVNIDAKRDTVINISLSGNIDIEEVVVTAKSRESGIESTKMGSIDVPVKLIQHTPSLLGETDVLRTIQLTPGVQQGVGGASTLYVRGGNGDENLVLLDGAPVYKIDHLFGFFSVFTPEAVKKVTFYKTSFPARYNGRTSSVIDVRTKDGDMNEYHGSASIGLLTSRINLEGPIVKGKTSFSLSGRTTYISAITRPLARLDDFTLSYWFYDLNLKVNHKFSDNDRIYFALYNGLDKLYSAEDIDDFSTHYLDIKDENDEFLEVPMSYAFDEKLQWANFIPSLRWNHVFSQKLFANTTVNYNHYKMFVSSYDKMEWHYQDSGAVNFNSQRYNSEIKDYGATVDFDYLPAPEHTVKFGANYICHDFVPETTSSRYKNTDEEERADTSTFHKGMSVMANEVSVYADDDWQIMPNLNANIGLSYTLFALKERKYHNVQPRLSVKYSPLSYLSFKAAYSRMSQCVHLLTSSPISLPTDLWVPITKDIEPETADQYSVGTYCTVLPGWEFSVEAYYKKINNVLEYKDGMSFMGFSSSWTDLVAAGRGWSKGIELMVQKTEGDLTGMVSYTLSKTDRQFDRNSGVNDGRRFPFSYDRRHNFNIVANYQLNDHIDIDASWTFYSGARATLSNTRQQIVAPDDDALTSNYTIISAETYSGENRYINSHYTYDTEYIPNRNNYLLPSTHLLCLGANFHKQKKRCERIFNLSVYNAYNAMNPSFVFYFNDYNERLDVDNSKLEKITILPLIPSFTLTYKF